MRPRVIGEFLRRYQGHPFPNATIGKNVLDEMGVPSDRAGATLELIVAGANSLGLLRQIKDKQYVELDAVAMTPVASEEEATDPHVDDSVEPSIGSGSALQSPRPPIASGAPRPATDPRRDLIYISHGTNKALLATIQKSLKIGGLQAVISVERATVSTSISAKVLREMRTCGGAIIHIDVEHRVALADGKERVILNENVLIEIGAAMALYGDRFILLVKDGIELPSNLKGSFEVRYKGEALDGDEAFRLLESLHDLKTHPLPGEGA
jgi:predicted nucleotide-binding protein